MKKRMCALLAALGGSLLLLAGCSSFAERFSRPESRAESTTAAESRTAESSTAESRASESNATESGEESTAEASGETESGAEQLAAGESAGGESAAETAADGETLAAAESSAEMATVSRLNFRRALTETFTLTTTANRRCRPKTARMIRSM